MDAQLVSGVDDLLNIGEDDLRERIRYDEETKRFSIIDVIMILTGKDRNHSAEVLRDMLGAGTLGKITSLNISYHKFSGRGQKHTPVAPLKSIVEIILLIPSKTTNKWKLNAAQVLCRAFLGDMVLVDEIIKQHEKSTSEAKDIVARSEWTQLKNMDFSFEPQCCDLSGIVYIAGSPDIPFIKIGSWGGTSESLFSRYKMYYGPRTWIRKWNSEDRRRDEYSILFSLKQYSFSGELFYCEAKDLAVNILNSNLVEQM